MLVVKVSNRRLMQQFNRDVFQRMGPPFMATTFQPPLLTVWRSHKLQPGDFQQRTTLSVPCSV
jgi:hypothetical protein